MAQLWGGRFTKETDQLVYNFNASISFDKRFYEQDIRGSIAHVTMLAKQGILTEEEKKLLSTFEARLRHLIYLHDELKRENAELKQLLEDEKAELEKVKAEYKALESNYTDLKTATAISLNGSDVKETKLRLSKLVREVDKCIALLNE